MADINMNELINETIKKMISEFMHYPLCKVFNKYYITDNTIFKQDGKEKMNK